MSTEKFYINGQWINASAQHDYLDVVNPANEQVIAQVAIATDQDVDTAVEAAHDAFDSFAQTSVDERIALLEGVLAAYLKRIDKVGAAIQATMGAPRELACGDQAGSGTQHLKATITALKNYTFEEKIGSSVVLKEPIGVCGLITPWNWPANQIACKVAPALAAGCTMVLKPSEMTPLDAVYWAECMEEAGVPPGVFNLLQGNGEVTGAALSRHPLIDMMSFTGSTRAGALISTAGASTVKRVALELGGKSPNIILDDADLEQAVRQGVENCFNNAGQSCDAPSRMLIPQSLAEEAYAIAKAYAEQMTVGDPNADVDIGPLSSARQFDHVQRMIEKGISEGAQLITGGLGRPDSLSSGYYAKPTIFGDVSNQMAIAQEEIFGPVLCVIPYQTEETAVEIANDTPYGLSSYISSSNSERALALAKKIRAGMVLINNAELDPMAPFGGYKQSGNGREWGAFGLDEYLEIKAVMGSNGST